MFRKERSEGAPWLGGGGEVALWGECVTRATSRLSTEHNTYRRNKKEEKMYTVIERH